MEEDHTLVEADGTLEWCNSVVVGDTPVQELCNWAAVEDNLAPVGDNVAPVGDNEAPVGDNEAGAERNVAAVGSN